MFTRNGVHRIDEDLPHSWYVAFCFTIAMIVCILQCLMAHLRSRQVQVLSLGQCGRVVLGTCRIASFAEVAPKIRGSLTRVIVILDARLGKVLEFCSDFGGQRNDNCRVETSIECLARLLLPCYSIVRAQMRLMLSIIEWWEGKTCCGGRAVNLIFSISRWK